MTDTAQDLRSALERARAIVRLRYPASFQTDPKRWAAYVDAGHADKSHEMSIALAALAAPATDEPVAKHWAEVDAHRDLSRIIPDMEAKIVDAKRLYDHCLPKDIFAPLEMSITELRVLRHEVAHPPAAEPVGLRDAVIAAMTDDPYWNDAAGTTDHDARLQHYADVIVAKLQGKEAS